MDQYDFAVWNTSGGGVVKYVEGNYILVKLPLDSGLKIGDKMPAHWSVISPANERARKQMGRRDKL